MENQKMEKIRKFGFEFLSIFIGVFAAFALDNWNENRKDHHTELKILAEIQNGLKQDIVDIHLNEQGHKDGLRAVSFFEDLILNKHPATDSVVYSYFHLLRNFISIQNVSGYETLKSKGLEIVANDSLRTQIISLYENDYNAVRKLEENYPELQFFTNYFKTFNGALAPNFILDKNGRLSGINDPLKLNEKEKKELLTILWKIKTNRNFMLGVYREVKDKSIKLQKTLTQELQR